ncbi:MAG: hypothetical protein GWN86_02635, partial [Desulfobacterales bacterium]|nr:hypothetical protein [Desulfobacterales bacterium]
MGLKSVKLFKDWFCCGRDQRILSLLFILFLGFVLMMVPIPFLRLHDDEAIYWSISQSLGHGEPRTVRLSSLPFFLVAGVLQISNHLFTARIISSLFTLGSAVLIFLIGEAWWGGRAGSAGALIYLFSFHALRFGSRYLLEGYGSFFFLLTVYLLQRHRVGMAGLFSILPLLCTEVWIPVYPFYWLYVHRRKESLQ